MAQHMKGITAKIHQGTAAKRQIMPDIPGNIGYFHIKGAAHGDQRPQLAGPDNFQNPGKKRMVEIMKAFDTKAARLQSHLNHAACFAGIHGKGFFAEHMTPSLHSRNVKWRVRNRR